MRDIRDGLRRRYLDSIPRKLETLEHAEDEMRTRQPHAIDRARALCHQLAGSGSTYGFDKVTTLARAVEVGDPDGVADGLCVLREHLEQVYKTNLTERRRKLLVVEDDPDMAAVFTEVWSAFGKEADVVGTGKEAMVALAATEYALVILDLILPDADGREILRQMRDMPTTANTPVVVVTASVGRETQLECIELGVDHFLEKPVDIGVLAASIGAAIKRGEVFRAEARRDSLTGLRNRSGFREAVLPQLSLAERSHLPCSIALLDLDRFKAVNDEYGHPVGDVVLKGLADILTSRLRSSDLIGRWGGEEFIVALPHTTASSSVLALRKVLRRFSAAEFKAGDQVITGLTFSAGVTEVTSTAHLDEAIEIADAQLYRAKAAGRNRVLGEGAEASTNLSVLLAEDDVDAGRMIQILLERDGFDVRVARDGHEACERAAEHTFDVVLLDWQMPKATGDEVLVKLRANPLYERVPIVMLTAFGDETRVARAFELGADDYVEKPFRPTELVARVRRLLTRA